MCRASELPTPPEWLTSGATGACAVDVLGSPLAGLYVGGLGGAIRYNDATNNLDRVWIVLTSAMPYASCADLAGVMLIGVPILTETPNVIRDILKRPLITTVS